MKAMIDIDWLDAEIENLNSAIEQLIEKRSNAKTLSTILVIDSRMNLLSHELLVLHNLRKKCEPIEEATIVNYDAKNSTTESVFQHDTITYKHLGVECSYELPIPTKCLLDWESAKYCHNENKCLMCKTKLNN